MLNNLTQILRKKNFILKSDMNPGSQEQNKRNINHYLSVIMANR